MAGIGEEIRSVIGLEAIPQEQARSRIPAGRGARLRPAAG
jgi:hypothetical protein